MRLSREHAIFSPASTGMAQAYGVKAGLSAACSGAAAQSGVAVKKTRGGKHGMAEWEQGTSLAAWAYCWLQQRLEDA